MPALCADVSILLKEQMIRLNYGKEAQEKVLVSRERTEYFNAKRLAASSIGFRSYS
jgi:hypothetical protein